MSADVSKMSVELEEILDAVSYEITAARAAGLKRPEDLRTALKRDKEMISDADSLASHIAAERAESRDRA